MFTFKSGAAFVLLFGPNALSLAQDPPQSNSTPSIQTPVVSQNQLGSQLDAIQREFQEKLKVQEAKLAEALEEVKNYKANAQQNGTELQKLQNAVDKLAVAIKKVEDERSVREKIRRDFETAVLRAKLEALSHCVGYMGSTSDQIALTANTAALELRFGSFGNVSAISPVFVDKVRKLGKNVPSFDSLSGQFASNPIFAIGISLVSMILPKKKPQAISDVEDILSVSEALVAHRELTIGTSTKFESVASSARGVNEGVITFFDGLNGAFAKYASDAPLVVRQGYIYRTHDSNQWVRTAFESIGRKMDEMAKQPDKGDPDVLLVQIRGQVEALQRQASSLLGVFKPLVGDLRRSWDYQATGIATIQSTLNTELLPGEDSKRTARADLRDRLAKWALDAKNHSATIEATYDRELRALQGLILG